MAVKVVIKKRVNVNKIEESISIYDRRLDKKFLNVFITFPLRIFRVL